MGGSINDEKLFHIFIVQLTSTQRRYFHSVTLVVYLYTQTLISILLSCISMSYT